MPHVSLRAVLSVRRLVLLSVLALCAQTAPGAVDLPALFGDNMVLQAGVDAPVWGWADSGEAVTLTASWRREPISVEADEQGRWKLELPTPAAGGPHTVVVEGSNRIEIANVMIGEVWICSGQSNMEMCLDAGPMSYYGVLDYEKEIAAADFAQIRLFTVPRHLGARREADCDGAWLVCSPETVKTFSAAGYFFGRTLHRDLGVPVGLICSSWGGTPAESWTSEARLRTMGDFNPALDALERFRSDRAGYEAEQEAKLARWAESLNDADLGCTGKGWMAPDWDDRSWPSMDLPCTWQGEGLGDFDGMIWFRRTVEIPHEWAGKELVLELGPIDDADAVYFNGRRVGGVEKLGHWYVPRRYTIPAGLAAPGGKVIAVRVLDTGGAGGINGTPDQMVLSRAAEGEASARLPLHGAWRYMKSADLSTLDPAPAQQGMSSHTPTVLFNGMIAPLVPFAMRGVIWYQGESNRLRAAQYEKLFPLMIGDWRAEWAQGDFPFYFVQIAPFAYGDAPFAAAALRDAQTKALACANTGMAVTLDIGNPYDIHPNNKQEVGRRLALWALAKTYGREGVVYSGPLYRRMEIDHDRIRLGFDHVGGGLAPRDEALSEFVIAGDDRRFYRAQARIDGREVLVWSDRVADPVAVRFAWCNVPEANLRNAEGLPAAPFRTDDWPAESVTVE